MTLNDVMVVTLRCVKAVKVIKVRTQQPYYLRRKCSPKNLVFSERELMFMFAICRRASVCLSSVCLSVCRLSVTFVHPTQPIEIFGNVSAPFNTLVT